MKVVQHVITFTVGAGVGAFGLHVYNQKSKPTTPSPAQVAPPSHAVQIPAAAAPAVPERIQQLTRYGVPNKDGLIFRTGYVISYDSRTRNPKWVLEHLRGLSQDPDERVNVDRENQNFKEDPAAGEFRAKLSDYAGSGYDRGHMVAAADIPYLIHNNGVGPEQWAAERAMTETFLLTNISPQVGTGFNRGYWAQLERFVRLLTKMYDDVYCITGPLFLPYDEMVEGKMKHFVKYEVIGNPANVAVPTHFYKVILVRKKGTDTHSKDGVKQAGSHFHIGAFVLPNKPIPDNMDLKQFIMPVDQVEFYAGLKFFENVDRNSIGPALCSDTKCYLPSMPKFPKKEKEAAK